jgi:membrane-bound lytic murein transglycosylase D
VLVIIPANRFNEIRVSAELSKKSGIPTKDLGFPLLKRETSPLKSNGRGGVFYKINNLDGIQAEMCDNAVTLAYKADIPIKKFVEYNDIKENDLLHIGQVYYLEAKSAKASVPLHVVREGETLWSISQIYGLKLENLLKYNRFETVQRLQRGRVLWLQTARPKNKPIEYINMPDELEAIDAMVRAESNAEFNEEAFVKEPMKVDTIVLIDKPKIELKEDSQTKSNFINTDEAAAKEKQLNSVPLTQEIRKEETLNLNLQKTVDKSNVTPPVQTKNQPESKNTPTVSPQSTNTLKEKTTEQGNFLNHTVRKDDTLFKISVDYNVTLEELWRLNNLNSNIVKPGIVLKIKRL